MRPAHEAKAITQVLLVQSLGFEAAASDVENWDLTER